MSASLKGDAGQAEALTAANDALWVGSTGAEALVHSELVFELFPRAQLLSIVCPLSPP